MEGYVAEAMDAGALGLSTGLEFKPGRDAPTDEIVRLNKVVGRYGGPLHEPHPQPRRATSRTRSRSSCRSSARAARRARSRTSTSATAPAPRRAPGSARSTRCRRRARSRASTCSPTRRRSATGSAQMAGILPPWVLADGWEEALQAAARPGGPRAAARRVRPLLALHPPGRVGPRPPAGEPAVPGARGQEPSPRSRRCWGRAVGCYFDILAAAGPGDRQHAPDRRALHRRAPGRDDLAPPLLARRRRLHERARRRPRRRSRASGLLRRPRALPHPPRAARSGRCRSRRRSGR